MRPAPFFGADAGNGLQFVEEVLADLSLLGCAQGRLAEGREYARAAIVLSEQAGDKTNLANAFYYPGRIELALLAFEQGGAVLARERIVPVLESLGAPGCAADGGVA